LKRELQVQATDKGTNPAMNYVDAHAQDKVVTTHPESIRTVHFADYTLLDILYTFSVRVAAELSVAATNSSLLSQCWPSRKAFAAFTVTRTV